MSENPRFDPATQYRCARCGGVFDLVEDETWNDAAAAAERERLFPGIGPDQCDTVCDDCFRAMGLHEEEGPVELRAGPGRCEEASPLSREVYIPCNAPATRRIWSARDRRVYRMCEPCADHAVRNRGMRLATADDEAAAANMA